MATLALRQTSQVAPGEIATIDVIGALHLLPYGKQQRGQTALPGAVSNTGSCAANRRKMTSSSGRRTQEDDGTE